MNETVFNILEQLKNNQISQEEANRRMLALKGQKAADTEIKPEDNASASVTSEKHNVSLETILKKIKKIFSDLLGLDEEEFDLDEELREYGIESILQTKIVDAINESFSIDCMTTLFYELKKQTIMGLAEYLLENFNIVSNEAAKSIQPSHHENEQETIHEAVQVINNTTSVHHQGEDNNDIAIIGIDIKAPDSDDCNEFWNNLINNKDCISDIPDSMIKESTNNKNEIRRGGFIRNIENFDYDLFHISNREAIYMDPQQRVMLESVYRLFEDAGYRISDFYGSNTGVFIAAATHDYIDLLHKYCPDDYEAHFSTGTSNSIIANRVSFVNDFHGPSEVVDTACSGSLVSLHHAVQSLKMGECDLAIAGGVNLNLSISTFDVFQKAGMLSKDGKCKTLSDDADGYVRGEGVGTLLLKPLKKAIADKDNIYGIIKGSAVNHGGKANSLTAPNINAQSDVIIKAIKNSGVDTSEISYVELHGTGTNLGDPAEIRGLKKAFDLLYNESNTPILKNSCGIGSVKTNIGHLESAAGVSGVIKILLSLKNNCLPSIINYSKLNNIIDLEDSPFYVVDKNTEWKRKTDRNGIELPRCASVSSFGFGGTNAHVVIKEYINNNKPNNISDRNLFVFSACDNNVLEEYIRSSLVYIKNSTEAPYDIAYTLYTGRERMNKRAAFIASDLNELYNMLEKWLTDKSCSTGVYSNYSEDKPELENTNDALCNAAYSYVFGSPVDSENIFSITGNHVTAPYYPFNKTNCWLTAIPSRKKSISIASCSTGIAKLKIINEIPSEDIIDTTNPIKLSSTGSIQPSDAVKPEIFPSVSYDYPLSNDAANDDIKLSIIKLLSEVLYKDESSIPLDQNFIDIGLDSILCVEFIDKLNKRYNTNYTAVITYDYSTVNKLTEFLSGNVMTKEQPIENKNDINMIHDNIEYSGGNETETIKKICSEILFCPEENINIDTPFNELGMDSILCVEFVEKINSKFGIKISTNTIYDCVNISTLSQTIAKMNSSLTISEKMHIAEPEKEESINFSNIKDDDIAIIGISLRTADADNADQFWNNIINGLSSIDIIPKERWNIDEYFDTDMTKQGKMYCKYGAFMKNADCFDSAFFNISPAEASKMDPSHRILIEEIYKSLDDAGYTADDLNDMRCSLYTGISTGGEYPVKSLLNNHSIACARIPYFLNLKGEAVSIDTACSSSLVALTLACRSINSHSSDMAIAAGVSLFLEPDGYVEMCRSGMLSRCGKCSAFDNSADGFIPGEAVASVVIKSARKAIEDGDNVYGIIKGISMNQDGKTNGITAPSAKSQASLEKAIYKQAGIDPTSIDYIECHGTGTKLGDPIEIAGLTESFSEYTNKKKFCKIGSVKTNVGHTACAAGLVSLIKVLLSMKHNELPPSLNFKVQNEHFDLKDTPFIVNDRRSDWYKEKKRAAVSSFGMGGTNVHAVVDNYTKEAKSKTSHPYSIILLSAKTEEALKNRIKRLYEWLSDTNEDISEIAYNLACFKTHFNVRTAIVVSDIQDLKIKLNNIISSGDTTSFYTTTEKESGFIDSISNVYDLYGKEALKKCLEALASRYMQGEKINWRSVYNGCNFSKISVPGYEFERKSYPIYKSSKTNDVVEYKKKVHYTIKKDAEFIHDNIAYGTNVMPIMSYLEYVKKGVKSLYGEDITCISALRAYSLLIIDDNVDIEVEVVKKDGNYHFAVYSCNDNTLHIKGIASHKSVSERKIDISHLILTHNQKVSGKDILDQYSELQHFSGHSLRSLNEVSYSKDNSSCLCKIKLPAGSEASLNEYFFHPSLLEGVIQAIGASLKRNASIRDDKYLSCGFEEFYLNNALPQDFYVYCDSTVDSNNVILESGIIVKNDGTVIGQIKDFIIKKMQTQHNSEKTKPTIKTDIKPELYNIIKNTLCNLLECDNIEPDVGLGNYGFSSLSLIDLARMLCNEFGFQVNVDILMNIDEITVNKITEAIYTEYHDQLNSKYKNNDIDFNITESINPVCTEVNGNDIPITEPTKCDVAVIGIQASDNKDKSSHIKSVFSTINKLLADAAYTKESLSELKVGVIAVHIDPEDNKLYADNKSILKNIAHKISKEYSFNGISETIITSEKNEISALNLGAEFVRYKKCDICLCISYSSTGITAILLKDYEKSLNGHDNIYCVIDEINVDYTTNAAPLTTDGKMAGFKSYQDLLEYIHNDFASCNNNCNEDSIDKIFNVYTSSNGNIVIKMNNADNTINMSLRRISSIKQKSAEKRELIILSSDSKEALSAHIEEIMSFLESKAVFKNDCSVFSCYDSHVYELISKNISYCNGEYDPDSVKNVIDKINEVFSTNIQPEEFFLSPSIGQFIHNTYVNEKEKIKSYYRMSENMDIEFNINLSDIAYTLQNGRYAKDYRIAFTANSVKELYNLISRWKNGEHIENLYENNLNENNIEKYNLFNGAEGSKMLAYLMESCDYSYIAKMWTLGLKVDWSSLNNKDYGYRISFPYNES